MTLGPVHYQMYDKIRLENELIEEIQKCAEKQEWEISRNYTAAYAPLDEVIDMNDVHHWIQNQMEDVERRLAEAVEDIIDGHEERLNDLKKAAYLSGYHHAVRALNADEAYQAVNALILNGMPCDDVIDVTKEDRNEVVWREKVDMHSSYWKDPSVYRELRSEMICGLLAQTGLKYDQNEGNYSISGTVQPL